MSNKAPHIFLEKAITRTCDKFIKLDKYVNSNKRITKKELKQLLDELRKPLFITFEVIIPTEEVVDFGDF